MSRELTKREAKGIFDRPGRPRKGDRRGLGAGRPTVFTPEVLTKLEQAYMYGMTDEEASVYAGIKSPQTLRNFIHRNPEFKYRKHQLKSKPIMTARIAVVDHLPNDPEFSLKFLERVKKDEFSLRSDSEIKNQTLVINLTPEQKERILTEG